MEKAKQAWAMKHKGQVYYSFKSLLGRKGYVVQNGKKGQVYTSKYKAEAMLHQIYAEIMGWV